MSMSAVSFAFSETSPLLTLSLKSASCFVVAICTTSAPDADADDETAVPAQPAVIISTAAANAVK